MEKNDNKAIVERAKYLIDCVAGGSQADFAKKVGLDPSNLSKYLSGRLAMGRGVVNSIVAALGVSRDWLLCGEGLPFAKSGHAVEVTAEEIAPAPLNKGVPVYDVDVTAGSSPLERILTVDRIKGYIDMPRINPDCLIVRVTGDSMEPKIIDGGYIAIRPIKSKTNIFWGQIYVIVMEEYRMVKCLRRHPDDKNMVILHSENPDYDDMDVSRDDIQALFLVETILNFKNVC